MGYDPNMQQSGTTGSRDAAAAEVRLDARIPRTVNRRLRMLALAQDRPLSHVLSVLLDGALPPAEELAASLAVDDAAEAVAS